MKNWWSNWLADLQWGYNQGWRYWVYEFRWAFIGFGFGLGLDVTKWESVAAVAIFVFGLLVVHLGDYWGWHERRP